LKKCPAKIDIGAIYTARVSKILINNNWRGEDERKS